MSFKNIFFNRLRYKRKSKTKLKFMERFLKIDICWKWKINLQFYDTKVELIAKRVVIEKKW